VSALILSDARIVTPRGIIDSGWLEVRGDRIAALGDGAAPDGARSIAGATVVPGFIDLHVHGGGGSAFGAGADGIRTTIAAHRRGGTTSMLASLSTAPVVEMARRSRELVPFCESGELLGIHLEGPFLSAGHRGAHPESELRSPDLRELDGLLDAGGGWVRSVTLAPELDGASDLIARLDAAGVLVAFGHTSATDEQMTRALDGRSGYITHLFNGMPSIHHREPGAVTAALLDPACVVELITDGIHLHPDIVRTVFRIATGRTMLITDAMAAAGLGDGEFEFGSGLIEVRDGRAWSETEHSLAGSTLTMAAAFRNTVAFGIPLAEASAAASAVPARMLGVQDESGAIQVGLRADLVILDAQLEPQGVFRAGVPVEETTC
jgi:N-acetylglucosamine-6-phosphate deacetylase